MFPDEDENIEVVEMNGEDADVDEEVVEESKYTTASSATAAENDISDVRRNII